MLGHRLWPFLAVLQVLQTASLAPQACTVRGQLGPGRLEAREGCFNSVRFMQAACGCARNQAWEVPTWHLPSSTHSAVLCAAAWRFDAMHLSQ